jgi:predicted nucleic acid-binding protein
VKVTFIDAGVLIAAARGEGPIAARAMEILDDPAREFASSVFVRLEVLPKAIYHRKTEEAEFYQAFFDSVTRWANGLEQIVQVAEQQASSLGLATLDALHLAAALAVGAEEIVTTEDFNKPIHRATSLQVVSLRLTGERD